MNIKLSSVFANLTATGVVELAEIEEKSVEIKVECGGCGLVAEAWADTAREARKRLARRCIGWGVVFDREVNDGNYPYCPRCIKSIFPNLQARLKASIDGKPLPPIPKRHPDDEIT